MVPYEILEPVALRKKDRCGKCREDLPEGRAWSEPVEEEERTELVCRACRTSITRPDLAMEVNGSHRHVFFNPHGLVFELGCFASAWNVSVSGPESDEFTWFPGYTWQVVICAGCAAQLGWRYTSARGGFFGLIVAALDEEAHRLNKG
ncbi:cereblon family protein [Pseudodesulfovibrio sp.]|uniref:cereblon family protein n=1 Tax=unclassified Pseudodesulfovibrio TaxID=2661612 RepID=UPI003AFF923A